MPAQNTPTDQRASGERYRRGLLVATLPLVLLGIVLLLVLPALRRQRELSRRLVCASNMKRVATVAKIYGWHPLPEDISAIERLVELGLVTRDETICASSGLTHSNYVLVPIESTGRGLDSRTPVMYEPKSNHGGEGGTFVFADGHATFQRGEAYGELVKRAAVYQRGGDR